MIIERRADPLAADISVNEKRLVGHAAVFNSPSRDLGGFIEVIMPGAFQGSLGGDIKALLNHDSSFVLGRTTAGTLSVSEDERGLFVEITPPDTSYGRDLIVSVERGDVNQMSFGFRVRNGGETWAKDDQGQVVRTLTDIELIEVSPVTFPAYPTTDIAARSFENWIQTLNRSNCSRIFRMRAQLKLVERGISVK